MAKTKKGVLALLMLFIVAVATVAPVYARNSFGDEVRIGTTNIVQVKQYSFEITEYVDSLHRITRTFQRNIDPFGGNAHSINAEFHLEANIYEAKALLLALGKNIYAIDLMSYEDLADISRAQRIYTTVAYMQEDMFGNVQYICGIYATQQAAHINAMKLEKAMLCHYGIMIQDIAPQNTINHGHIQITHTVAFLGLNSNLQERFLFSTSATWLTMPFFRNRGSIGSVAQTVAIESMNRANFSYTTSIISNGNISTMEGSGSASNNWVTNGDLAGAAAYFRLPSDVHTDFVSVIHSNFTVNISHRAVQRHAGYFNSRGTYVHRTINLVPSPSISISKSGPSIGLGFRWGHNVYNSRLLLIRNRVATAVPGS